MSDNGEDRNDNQQEEAPTSVGEAAMQGMGGMSGQEAFMNVPLTLSVVLGTTHMSIRDMMRLGRGAVIELDRNIGSLLDIYANDRLVARGEFVLLKNDRLGVTMTEIVRSQDGGESGS